MKFIVKHFDYLCCYRIPNNDLSMLYFTIILSLFYICSDNAVTYCCLGHPNIFSISMALKLGSNNKLRNYKTSKQS